MVYDDDQRERDDDLVRKVCYHYQALHQIIENWMAQEINALPVRIQTLEAMTQVASQKTRLTEALKSVDRISRIEMIEATERLTERLGEIERSLYDNPLESQQHAYDSFDSVKDLMRKLLDIRKMVDGLWNQSGPGGD